MNQYSVPWKNRANAHFGEEMSLGALGVSSRPRGTFVLVHSTHTQKYLVTCTTGRRDGHDKRLQDHRSRESCEISEDIDLVRGLKFGFMNKIKIAKDIYINKLVRRTHLNNSCTRI